MEIIGMNELSIILLIFGIIAYTILYFKKKK